MKLLLFFLAGVVIVLLTTAMATGITYPAQVIFFALLFLCFALLVKGVIAGTRGNG